MKNDTLGKLLNGFQFVFNFIIEVIRDIFLHTLLALYLVGIVSFFMLPLVVVVFICKLIFYGW